MQIYFEIQGKPFAKQRPRVSVKKCNTNGIEQTFARAYTPKETQNYENFVKMAYMVAGGVKMDGPIVAEIVGIFPIPKSESKVRQAAMQDGDIHYTKKIDCDNMAKTVLDALNGIAYDDDAQVFKLEVSKKYGSVPKVCVTLREEPDQYEPRKKR